MRASVSVSAAAGAAGRVVADGRVVATGVVGPVVGDVVGPTDAGPTTDDGACRPEERLGSSEEVTGRRFIAIAPEFTASRVVGDGTAARGGGALVRMAVATGVTGAVVGGVTRDTAGFVEGNGAAASGILCNVDFV